MKDVLNDLLDYLKQEHPDYEIKLRDNRFYRDDVERIYLEKKDDVKSFFYNHRLDRIVSNIIDSACTIKLLYGNMYTLHSYKKDNKVRVFLSITNVDHGKVYPVGFDLNTNKYFVFPIDEHGLIDEKSMEALINSEETIGVDEDIYKNSLKIGNLYYVLKDLGVTNMFDVTNEIVDYNKDEMNMLEELTRNRRKHQNK